MGIYPSDDVLLYEHNGSSCYGGLWNRHDIKVREADAWPNPNDDVAAWSSIGITEEDYYYDGTDFGYPGDADIRVVAIEQ